MYNTLLRLYQSGRLTDQGLGNAVTKEWINAEQMQEIISSKMGA
jgi:hypothetical protein